MSALELAFESGELAGRRFAVGPSGLRLGRSSTNDIHVPDEELSRNHCMFELSADGALSVIDLSSANGTFVNGVQAGSAPVALSRGDVLEVGRSRLRVVEAGEPLPAAAPAAVDLGLGSASAGGDPAGPAAPAARRRLVVNVALAAAVAAAAAIVWFFVFGEGASQGGADGEATSVAEEQAAESVLEMRYERVAADSSSVFRYFMALSGGVLKVVVDDISDEQPRHVAKSVALSDKAFARLLEILSDPALLSLDREYAGPDGDPPSLRSRSLRVVYSARVKNVRVVNTSEPEDFSRICDKLETFSRNELGIWAMQYSTDKLVEMAAESAKSGLAKWEDRDVEYGNLHASIAAFREAITYLETVNPKPPEYNSYREALAASERELERRYADQRFQADRALNLGDWEAARTELQTLCAMIPDREDERNREAAAKLLDVEKRLKKGGK